MILPYYYTDIPTYSNGVWTTTTFNTHDEFRDFVDSLFKEPGQYQFDETTLLFGEQARKFEKDGIYCDAPYNSKDFINYWDEYKVRNRKGVIFKNNGKTWYLTRYYYFWINFLHIYDKVKGKFEFPEVWDVQYHISLYVTRAILHFKHISEVKKRQIASSYFFTSILINEFWFEEGATLKMGASDKSYINDVGGSWKYLNEYFDFLNTNTGWYRAHNPGKMLNWQQKETQTINGKPEEFGNKSVIQGMTFEKSPIKGVGGPCMTAGHMIWMSNGTLKPIEKIRIGNKVMGADGLPKKVKQLFTGQDETYNIIQKRGITYTVTDAHKLYLKDREVKLKEKDKIKLMTSKEWLNLSSHKKNIVVGIRNNKPLEFKKKQVDIDPYFLGLWLGDGFRESTGIIVNDSLDPEITNYISEYAVKLGGEIHKYERIRKDYNYRMLRCHIRKLNSGKRTNFNSNILIPAFVKYNLFYNKHIPEDYLTNSIEVRKQLLAGLIDSDGYYDSKKGRFIVGTSNKIFAEQLRQLGISLGFYVRVDIKNHKGHHDIINTMSYVVNYMVEDASIIPTKVKRKQSIYVSPKGKHTTPIEIIPNGVQTYYGFECEDNLYLLEDGTITHNCKFFYYEEGGIAPTADVTYGYLKPAMKMGEITTGTFAIAGSVGELDKCNPLKSFILRPDQNGFLGVDTNLIDSKGTIGRSGLFIPEQWGMPPYIDKYGNSLIKEALDSLDARFKQLKKDLEPAAYQLEISQHPRNIEEAFAYRKESRFSQHLVSAQKQRIEDKEYPYELLDIFRNEKGKPEFKSSNKIPIREFPISMKTEDKTGIIEVWERPDPDAEFGTYYGSVDPVGVGKTTTSDSLFCIYIYKNDVQVRRKQHDEVKTHIERGKVVAVWTGRFDDINRTHERAELLIEIFNAWTVVENNAPLFITHMINKNKQKYLVPRDQILYLKDLRGITNINQEYGWKNVGTTFKDLILPYLIEYIKEVLDTISKPDGEIIKTIYGVERIPDIMAMVEMSAYTDDINVDRLVTLAALIAFVKVQQANRGYREREENMDKNLDNPKNLYKLDKGMFRHLGKQSGNINSKIHRSAFKNLK